MLVGLTMNSYGQSPESMEILRSSVRANLPNSDISGGNGSVILNISVIDLAESVNVDTRAMENIVISNPMLFGKEFLINLTSEANDSMYEIGVREISLFFVRLNNTKIYAGRIDIIDPKLIIIR